MTESGPDTGSPCIFPFIVGGITYIECADFSDMHDDDYYDYYSYNAKNGKWCSTQVRCSRDFPEVLFATSMYYVILLQVDSDSVHVTGKSKWGYCSEDCSTGGCND